MKRELTEAERVERAELMQSIKALYIPLSLFLSCVVFSAGVFCLYNNEPAGWGFIALTGLLAVTSIGALIKFQNPYRARGVITKSEETVD
jgi:hypothetical protein